MHVSLYCATTIGVQAYQVDVQVDVSYGLVNFFIVGLPDTAIKESTKRIQTALHNCGIRLPLKRITVNLAPADLKKVGTQFDLPIALGILCATDQLSIPAAWLQETIILGELSLDGSIRPIKGSLVIAHDAAALGKKRLIVPQENVAEAAVVPNIEVIGVNHLTQVVAYVRDEVSITPAPTITPHAPTSSATEDYSEVRGQTLAKRALQIAAAGNHHILFIGPPGAGKTMLAKRLPSIMPAMTWSQMLETTKIYSITGKLSSDGLITQRPFRNPHHSISQAGLIGGGSHPQPGEISLAHHGILFLDELTEFKRDTLEALRQPLENHEVCISRVAQTVTFPGSPLLVVALNPCPCGYYGDTRRQCICSQQQITKYLTKLSGPLLDRIDLQVHVQPLTYEKAHEQTHDTLNSATLKDGVNRAVHMQAARGQSADKPNALLTSSELEAWCPLTPAAQELLKRVFDKLTLSMRGYHKLLRVSRTIADLAEQKIIDIPHIQEALTFRSLDQFLERQRKGI